MRYLVYIKRYNGSVGLFEMTVECETVEVLRSGAVEFRGVDDEIVMACGRGEWVYFKAE